MNSLHDRAKAVLDQMVAESVDGLWTGRTTQVVAAIAGAGAYGKVMRLLKTSGAIEQISRGARGQPSVWRITNADADVGTGTTDGGTTERKRNLERRVEELERLVGGVNVPDAITELLKRMPDA